MLDSKVLPRVYGLLYHTLYWALASGKAMLSFGSLRAYGLITRLSAEVPLNTTEQMSYELLQEFRGDNTVVSNMGGERRKSWILVGYSSLPVRRTAARTERHHQGLLHTTVWP